MATTTIRKYVAPVAIVVLALCAPSMADVIGVQPSDPAPTASGRPVMGNEKLLISPDELARLKRAGLEGDGAAANTVGQHYLAIVFDNAAAQYWMTISAENGSYLGMLNLTLFLVESKSEDDRTRAGYWLRRVSREGPEDLAQFARNRLKHAGMADAD